MHYLLLAIFDFETYNMSDAVIMDTVDHQSDDETAIYTEKRLIELYGVHEPEIECQEEVKAAIKRKLRCSGRRTKKIAKRLIPPLNWLPKYKFREMLVSDLIAGLTVGVVHLPQGMAYGILASLPAVTGLYVSFFPVLVYFLFGTSRQVSIGTFAVISLMIAQVINENVTPCPTGDDNGAAPTGTQSSYFTSATQFETISGHTQEVTTATSCQAEVDRRKIELAVALAMSSGIIQVIMCVFRLGIITAYLSTHLISGFTCGAAFHVLTSQVFKLLGIPYDRFDGPLALIYSWIELFKNITKTNWATVIISVVCILFLVAGKMINEKLKDRLPIPVPWELGVVILGTIASYFGDFSEKYDVDIVGTIPTGIQVSVPTGSDIGATFLGALPIAIVAFATEISLSQMFATKHSYKVDSNQELLALGLGNMVGSFFSCFPSSPSLSRSVVCDEAGAKTQLYGVFSSALILIVMLWIGPLFEDLPQAALGSIIVVNLKGLLRQFEKIPPLWRVRKTDAVTWIVTWTSVFLLGVSLGLGVAVAFQIFTVVLSVQFTKGTWLGLVGGTQEYRDVEKYRTNSKDIPDVIAFRFLGPVIFVNSERFKSEVFRALGFDPTTAAKARDNKAVNSQPKSKANPSFVEDNEGFAQFNPENGGDIEHNVSNKKISSSRTVDDTQEITAGTKDRTDAVLSIHRRTEVTHFILDMSGCPYIDNDGAKAIQEVHLALDKVEVKLFLASCNAEVRRLFSRVCQKTCPPIFISIASAMVVAKGDVTLENGTKEEETLRNSKDDDTRV